MEDPKRIALVECFYQGSHAYWVDHIVRYSAHKIDVYKLPGKHWKWRMQSGAIDLARAINQSGVKYDLVLTTSMTDVALLKSLLHQPVKICLYFHENQLVYPTSTKDSDRIHKRDNHYAFKNFTSALSSDSIAFNSAFNRNSFFENLPAFLNQFPDFKNKEEIKGLQEKSKVIPIGIETPPNRFIEKVPNLILWNHRWEQDKGIVPFLELMQQLKTQGLPFKLALLGQGAELNKYTELTKSLKSEIVFQGFPSKTEYWNWLLKSSILPVTSYHDFFGISVVEAILAGVYPILPNRLAYPEHLAVTDQACFYSNEIELKDKLEKLLKSGVPKEKVDLSRCKAYSWGEVIKAMDSWLN